MNADTAKPLSDDELKAMRKHAIRIDSPDRLRLLATITTLTASLAQANRDREQANAENAAIISACVVERTYEGEAPAVIEHHCKVCRYSTYNDVALEHAKDCPLANPKLAATALLEKLKYVDWLEADLKRQTARAEAAEANQRTPGTVEVCEVCLLQPKDIGPFTCPKNKATDCPLRKGGAT